LEKDGSFGGLNPRTPVFFFLESTTLKLGPPLPKYLPHNVGLFLSPLLSAPQHSLGGEPSSTFNFLFPLSLGHVSRMIFLCWGCPRAPTGILTRDNLDLNPFPFQCAFYVFSPGFFCFCGESRRSYCQNLSVRFLPPSPFPLPLP